MTHVRTRNNGKAGECIAGDSDRRRRGKNGGRGSKAHCIVWAILAITTTTLDGSAYGDEREEARTLTQERAQLHTECEKVIPIVSVYANVPRGREIEEAIEEAVVTRLADAGVLSEKEKSGALLKVIIDGSQTGEVANRYLYSVTIELSKHLRDWWGNGAYLASWQDGSYGYLPAKDAKKVWLESVEKRMDNFLDEYLRINAADC